MLSKEECMNKLDKMAELMPLKSEYGYGCSEIDFNEMMNFVEQLINDYFDLLEEYKDCRRELNSYYDMMCNPPLKFEELKEGMWVWNNEWHEYLEIAWIECKKRGFCVYDRSDGDYLFHEFKDGILFRKQVKE